MSFRTFRAEWTARRAPRTPSAQSSTSSTANRSSRTSSGSTRSQSRLRKRPASTNLKLMPAKHSIFLPICPSSPAQLQRTASFLYGSRRSVHICRLQLLSMTKERTIGGGATTVSRWSTRRHCKRMPLTSSATKSTISWSEETSRPTISNTATSFTALVTLSRATETTGEHKQPENT